MRKFVDRVLKGIFGPRREEVTENYIMWSFITCTVRQIILG
jgi:hypothetical protein